MTLMQVTTSDGQVSGVDNLSPAASYVSNWEIDESGINRPRAALTAYSVTGLTTAQIIGIERWINYTVLVDDDRKMQVISDAVPGVATSVSDTTSASWVLGAHRPTWVSGHQYVYATGGGQVQRWKTGMALSEALSSSPSCTHIASTGQYLIANDTSQADRYWWSGIGESAWGTWPAANFSTYRSRPDVIQGVFDNAGRVFIFGKQSVQIHEVGSDPTLPFDLIAAIDVGLAAPYAFTKFDQEVAFLNHHRQVCIGGPTSPSVSAAIDKDLRNLSTVTDCHMYRENFGQHSSLVVRFPTAARTFVYDLKGSSKWKERDYYSAPFRADYPVNGYVYRPSDNAHIVASTNATGALYKLSTDTRRDLSGALVCERTTGWQDFGTANRKRSNGQVMVLRRGTGTLNSTPGAYEIRKQDDHGPWSPWEQVSIGEPHQYEQKCKVRLHGVFTRRRYGVRVSTSEETSLVSLHDDVTDLGVP